MKQGNILVVDDEYGIRTGIRQILEMEGFTVAEAETGRDAIAAIDRTPPDVILIDYRLPDIDGLTLLQAIRSRKLDVMTCMITAYANIETAIAATRQGIDFFLPKPFSPDDLVGVVETLLSHKASREEAKALRLAHEASLLALASEKSQTHSLVESLRDAVLVVNREGEVVLVNRAMAALLGGDEERLVRQPVGGVLGAEPFAPIRAALGASSANRALFDMTIGDRQYMASLAPFHSDRGEVLGHILTVSDISEIRRLTLEKSRFIRTMIHEFRAPLGAVKGILEVLQDRSLGDTLAPYLPMVDRAEKRLDALAELIGNLLSISQIEVEGRRGAQLSPLDLSLAVAEVVELHRVQAEARDLTCRIETEPGLAALIDGEDFKTILTNLIGNAVKYNRDHGTITVRAGRAKGEALIDVADTGLGIRPENLPHVFDEFFREKRPETREIDGNGLGLSIVKRLVERAAGRMEIESTVGQGTTFRLHLPLAGAP
jgi:signal transduction histidine kinase